MRKQLRAIVLLVPLLVVMLWNGFALLRKTWPMTRPFVGYHLYCRDSALNVVAVSVAVYGVGGDRMGFFVSDAGGRPPEPIGLTAIDLAGDTLDVQRGERRWVVLHGGRDFTLRYDLTLTVADRYNPQIDNMLTLLDRDRCRIMGRDVFIIPECTVARGVFVDMEMGPRESQRSAWPSNGERIVVPAIEDLPLTVAVSGDYRLIEATVGGAEVTMAIGGDWMFSDGELFDLIRRVVLHEILLFGSPPHDSYLFVCDRNPVGRHDMYGNFGVHFARNMVLLLDARLDRSDLFDIPMSIIAHEFFHNWNGDAVKPASDRMLWFTEGVTVYYSYRILLDINVIVPAQYEARRDYIANRYHDNPYRRDVAIALAGNTDLNDLDMVNLLYDGGFCVAEALDGRLCELTGGRVHLIDVLRSLYEEGVDGDGLDEATLCETIRRVSGVDLSSYLHELVHENSPEELSGSSPRVPAEAVSPVELEQPPGPPREASSL